MATHRSALVVGVTLLALACGSGAQLRGQIAGLQQVAEQAERNGALRCAPRELALALSQLKFASLELDQGYASKAAAHLVLAEANAHAAALLSPPQYCAERAFIDATPARPGDQDGDGLLDPEDKCPKEPENYNGYQDEDGCPDDPDTDGDGIPDSLDQCTLIPEDADGFLDSDGCPEPDNDLDGIPDAADQCPQEPEDADGYEDADGCPEPDNDADGVPDVEDACPNEPGPADGDPKGCPQKPTLAIVTDCEVKITQQIHFAFNKAVIQPDSFPVLDAVVEVLGRIPSIKLEVQGHTDNAGTAVYNRGLSDRRAAAVVKYLVSRGVSLDRLTSKGYGFDRPLVPNDSLENKALNRRVQFVRTEGAKEGCPKTGD